MKIPTLLGLTILSVLLIIGIGVKIYSEQNSLSQNGQTDPKNVTQSNLTPTSISLSYDTALPATTQIIYSTNKSLLEKPQSNLDDRDRSPTPRNLHFVTLQELTPGTTYFFKIQVGSHFFPDQPLSFSTPSLSSETSASLTAPLVGTVIGPNLQPAGDVLVLLQTANYLSLATYTNPQGGFVLTFKPLYKRDSLTNILKLPADIDAQLIASKGELVSTVDIHLSQIDKLLPPIILGQNIDLRDYVASIEATPKEASPASQTFDFDINGDGKINTLDVAIVTNNIGRKKPTNPKADINKDGVVDQKDLDLIKSFLP